MPGAYFEENNGQILEKEDLKMSVREINEADFEAEVVKAEGTADLAGG